MATGLRAGYPSRHSVSRPPFRKLISLPRFHQTRPVSVTPGRLPSHPAPFRHTRPPSVTPGPSSVTPALSVTPGLPLSSPRRKPGPSANAPFRCRDERFRPAVTPHSFHSTARSDRSTLIPLDRESGPLRVPFRECGDPYRIDANRSFQQGFVFSIRASFYVRRHFLMAFSRRMADSIVGCASNQTS